MIVGLSLFMQLAASCAPSVAPETLAALARTESGFEAYILHDNNTRQSFKAHSLIEGAALASSLIDAGHNVDVGLMQVNSANFQHLGLTVVKALDPCASLAASARMLVEGYHGGGSDDEKQQALRDEISRYNTGSPIKGYANGYVHRVEVSAAQIVPAIRIAAASALEQPVTREPVSASAIVQPPPAVVVDMLHATEASPDEPNGLVNMLAGVVTEPESSAPQTSVRTVAR